MTTTPFKAKLLLFGEFSIVAEGNGLAIPFPAFQGQLAVARQNVITKSPFAESQDSIRLFADYIAQLIEKQTALYPFDIQALERDLQRGLYFDSNIPQGYGVGSSGALIAALYHRYVAVSQATYTSGELVILRQHFGQLESYFHGKSSGIDPLICYLDQAILIGANNHLSIAPPPTPLQAPCFLFLYDTQIERHTGPLVTYFVKRLQDPTFKQWCKEELNVCNQACIDTFLAGNGSQLWENMRALSILQSNFFQRMIPDSFMPTWQAGLDSDAYYFKICGAGGGGFMLGIGKDWDKVKSLLGADRCWKL